MQSINTRDSDPLGQFSLSIFRLNGFLMNNGNAITKSLCQSSARWQVLGQVGYQAQTVAQIARNMGHARQSVQRIADVLKKEGLVSYKSNLTDKRASLLELTPKGVETLSNIYMSYSEWSKHIMTKLNADQLARLAKDLNDLATILESDNYHNLVKKEKKNE